MKELINEYFNTLLELVLISGIVKIVYEIMKMVTEI